MKGVFAFFVHPMSIEDVAKKYKIAKKVSSKLVASVLKRRRPFVLSQITGLTSKTGVTADGFFIAIPLLTWQFYELEEEYVIKKLVKGCKVAKREGAKIVGLGAHTAIVGNGGRKLAKVVDIPITTGNTYTIGTAIEGTLKAAELMEINLKNSTLAVVGATGSIGSVCSFYLTPYFKRVILIGRNKSDLERVREKVESRSSGEVYSSTNISLIKEADVVVTVTGAIEAIINPKDIKSGAVICDVARPRDVAEAVVKVRPDVLVIDGGVVKAPGKVHFDFDIGLPKGLVLACIAETMILALEERYENYTLGKEISLERVNEMMKLASKHGFELAGLRSFDRALSLSQIEEIKRRAYEVRNK